MTLSTLCRCWVLTRTDGMRLGFTDHDAPLTVDGVTCEAVAALDASEARETLGLGADAQDVAGALDSPSLSEADIAAGRYDDARVDVYRVDWRAGDATLLRRATLGEITRADGAFTAELRGLAHRLDRVDMRRFTRDCDAVLGDARCGVDLRSFTTETVVATADGTTVTAAAAANLPDGWLAHGTLRVLDGGNAGTVIEIAAHQGARIELWQTPSVPLAAGVRIALVAGCDKRFATCRAKFDNTVAFRGFPHMPGGDFTLGYAAGETIHDGGALVE